MDERAAFREFVRTHHPDVGGDPEVFIAGLNAFRNTRAKPEADAEAERFDGPVVFVTRPPAWRRAVSSLRRNRRPPRVH